MRCRNAIVGALALCVFISGRLAYPQTSDDLFNDHVLQEVRFYMHPNDWATLKKNYGSNDYYPADFEWKYQERLIELPGVWIRSRGAGSRSDVKPGLRVDLDRDAPGRRFLGLRSFNLRNHTQDPSLIHDPLSMVFFRRLGMPAPREAHTRMYVNNEYIGLYSITESVDKDFLTRVFGENDGYLYQYDDETRTPYYFEYRGSDPALYSPIPFKPKTHEKDPDPRPIEAMIKAINQSSDSDFYAAVSEYLDLRQFMAHVAVERFLAEQDGVIGAIGLNNFYLYRFEKKNLSQFIAWDKDLAFFADPWEPIWRFITDVPPEKENRLMRRALKIPELKAVYLSTLARCATVAGGDGGFLLREVEREYQQIRQAAREDRNKQCYDAQGRFGLCSNEAFEEAFELLRDFARQRGKMVLDQVAANLEISSERSFTIPDRGGVSWTTLGVVASPSVGYARVLPSAGSSLAAGLAIFGFRQNDVLVTEAGVPVTPSIKGGRIYAEVDGAVSTALAIVNANDEPVTLSFYFTDPEGRDYGHGTTTLAARSQNARFLYESPLNGTIPVRGSFTFASSLPVAALALRTFINERSETLVTTLPVVELGAVSQDTVTLPHFADGGGWTTQIILVNTTDAKQSGTVQFFGQGSVVVPAGPVEVTIAGVRASAFSYALPARSARLLVTTGGLEPARSGSVRILPAPGSSAPSASAIFSSKISGICVTEAGVAAAPKGNGFRLYAEVLGTPGEIGAIVSGIALANPGEETLSVRLELTDLSGKSVASASGASVSIPPRGQIATFLNQIDGFASLRTPFQGILRITTSSPGGVAVVGLRGRWNERGDFLITTTPPVPEQGAGSVAGEGYLPHWVDGGGYTTQFVLLGKGTGSATTGTLRTIAQHGGLLPLALW